MAPGDPELKFITDPQHNYNRNEVSKIGEEIRAVCISRDGRPAAQLAWFLNGEPLREGLQQPRYQDSLTQNNITLVTVTQVIVRRLQPTDDSKILTCQALHPADRVERKAELKLTVQCMCSNRFIRSDGITNRK